MGYPHKQIIKFGYIWKKASTPNQDQGLDGHDNSRLWSDAEHGQFRLSPQAQLVKSTEISHYNIYLVQRRSESSADASLLSTSMQTTKYLVPLVTVDSIFRNAMQLENLFNF